MINTVTDSPMYMIASDTTFLSKARVQIASMTLESINAFSQIFNRKSC